MKSSPIEKQEDPAWVERGNALSWAIVGPGILVGSLVALFVVFWIVTGVVHWSVHGDALAQSIDSQIGGTDASHGDCKRIDAAHWQCFAFAGGEVSGGSEYAVTIDHGSCWTATLSSGYGEGNPPKASGCVTLADHIRFAPLHWLR